MGVGGESSFHVLAVDDGAVDRKMIERLLRISSFQVTTVDSASKALEFLGFQENDLRNPLKSSVSPSDHQEVDLVLTDYCMPGLMTGYDLLKKIKESSSLRNIPVVIMSSENVPSRITRCLEGGAEEFLLKPAELSDINRLKLHMMKAKTKVENPEQSSEPETKCQRREKMTKKRRKILRTRRGKPWKREFLQTEPDPDTITAALRFD